MEFSGFANDVSLHVQTVYLRTHNQTYISWHVLFLSFVCFRRCAKFVYILLDHVQISKLSTGKSVNLNKTYHQHFPIKGGNQKG